MTSFGGIRLVAHDPTLFVERKFVRIPGGYMNRWLIRAEVIVPTRNVIHDRVNDIMYCHPEMLEEIKVALIHAGAYRPLYGATK
jgi:hypothetical protein